MDIDSDGNTDVLLVGAPMFYQPHEKKEGRIYIYRLSDEVGHNKKSDYFIDKRVKNNFYQPVIILTDPTNK